MTRRRRAAPPDRARRLVAAAGDPAGAARVARLRYVAPGGQGIRRHRAGRGFRYVDAEGRAVQDAETLGRIRALAIPPAWTEVWICPTPHGHVQAVGRDARGRRQYRYHPRWREVRDEAKYSRIVAFANALPRVRARVEADLARPGLPREKVLAAVVKLLDTTLVRVGNEEYARANRSFGLTTLRDRHVEVAGGRIRLQFRGKGGKVHRIGLRDPRLARVVAERLGNTPAICRKAYVHPAVVEAYAEGVTVRANGASARLSAEEAAVLAFLRARLAA